jgi:hypothetical protein
VKPYRASEFKFHDQVGMVGLALSRIAWKQFRASRTYNLMVLFQRHPGWQQPATRRNLRFRRFVTADGLIHSAGKTPLKFAVPKREHE